MNGRRWGKSQLGIDVAIEVALQACPVGWFSPTYKMLGDVWRECTRLLQPVISRAVVQDKRLELVTGGVIEMWSLEDPDAGRSRKYKRVVIDEAALVRHLEQAWTESIRPTLADYKGDAFFLSTPKGHNYFWSLHNLGLDPEAKEWACWQMPTTANPYIDPAEVDAARQNLPERAFLQEFMAEFIEDSGGVFRNVQNSIDEGRTATDPKVIGRKHFLGVDLARTEDFTVLVVFDDKGRQCYLERFNQISWERQVGRIVDVAGIYDAEVWMDTTGVGDPVYENTQGEAFRRGLDITIEGYKFTATSKTALIDNLAMSIERGELGLMDNPTQTAELQAYQYDVTPSGNVRMTAPPGMHDDIVIALALAEWGRTASGRRIPVGIITPQAIAEIEYTEAVNPLLIEDGWVDA